MGPGVGQRRRTGFIRLRCRHTWPITIACSLQENAGMSGPRSGEWSPKFFRTIAAVMKKEASRPMPTRIQARSGRVRRATHLPRVPSTGSENRLRTQDRPSWATRDRRVSAPVAGELASTNRHLCCNGLRHRRAEACWGTCIGWSNRCGESGRFNLRPALDRVRICDFHSVAGLPLYWLPSPPSMKASRARFHRRGRRVGDEGASRRHP
ncbi:hypothetical protein Enr13x_51480 [Stieleria neptunia]|uniref:Uncharacterized protein n=1 Tax=Stieleria neptunia TaxID=2527979 RepID=A0A518HWN0_9BACT|nr:hypothetical protein Enr13x_51480 [Stieleria neptunia]